MGAGGSAGAHRLGLGLGGSTGALYASEEDLILEQVRTESLRGHEMLLNGGPGLGPASSQADQADDPQLAIALRLSSLEYSQDALERALRESREAAAAAGSPGPQGRARLLAGGMALDEGLEEGLVDKGLEEELLRAVLEQSMQDR